MSNIEIKGDIVNPLNTFFVKKEDIQSINVIEDISEITGNGIYILKETEPQLPLLVLTFEDGENYSMSAMKTTTDPTSTNYEIYVGENDSLTVDWGDGTSTTYEYGEQLPSNRTFQTSGRHDVTFDFSNCTIPTFDYMFEDSSVIVAVKFPYGATEIGDTGLYMSDVLLIDIPPTVTTLSDAFYTVTDGIIDVYWTNAEDIPSVDLTNNGQKVRIPNGTTAIYEANSDWNKDGETVFIERGA